MKFKIYVGIALFIIVLLLAGLDGALFYGASKLKSSTASISRKTDSFNKKADAINKSLQDLNTELQKQNDSLPASASGFSR